MKRAILISALLLSACAQNVGHAAKAPEASGPDFIIQRQMVGPGGSFTLYVILDKPTGDILYICHDCYVVPPKKH